MSINNYQKLTLVLSLLGREKFTERFLNYARGKFPPFKLLIGDGDPKSGVEKYLNHSSFSSMNYEYFKFDEKSPQDYFFKLESLLSKVSTPYVMNCDNDDFFVMSGLEKCIQFLDMNQDYIGCSGQISSFEHLKHNNKNIIIDEKYIYKKQIPIEQSSPLERAKIYFMNYLAPSWYNVSKTENVLNSMKLFRATGINDFLLMELFIAISLAIQGKQKENQSIIHYIRQTNSSQLRKTIKGYSHRLIFSNLGTEITVMKEALIAQLILASPEKTKEEITEVISSAFVDYLNKTMNNQVHTSFKNRFSLFTRRYNYSFRYFSSPYNRFCQKSDFNVILSQLKKHGASLEELSLFKQEYSNIRKIILHHPEAQIE